MTAQGSVTISARATDENDNSREVSQTIKVDTNVPVVTAKQESKNGNDVVVSLTADDGAAGSGVTRVLYSTGRPATRSPTRTRCGAPTPTRTR